MTLSPLRRLASWVALSVAVCGCGSPTPPVPPLPAVADEPPGPVLFEDVTAASGVRFTYRNGEEANHYAIIESLGGGVALFDYDGDGRLDVFLPGGGHFNGTKAVGHPCKLFRNLGGFKFADVSAAVGLAGPLQYSHGASAFDYDNDGWPDIFMVNGHVYPDVKSGEYRQRRILYRNGGAGKFTDISAAAGPAVMEKSSARGLSVGDYDNDGRPDLLITNMNERLSLLRNTLPAGNSITLKLIGQKSNRSAIGAAVRVTTGNRSLTGEVRSGSTFMSQSDFRLQFGLGIALKADAVEVQWPGGALEKLGPIAAGRIVAITEGKGVTANTPYSK